jgi:TonB dependent receptor/Carboxypeptidase regulatory-like domain
MTRTTRLIARAAVGVLVLLGGGLTAVGAQPPQAIAQFASLAPGSIHGIVQDEKGLPVVGAMVSALGTSSTFAVTDRSGRFEFRTLSPGPYIVRAHSAGFVASGGQVINVPPSARVSSSIALRHTANRASVLEAGFAGGSGSSGAGPDEGAPSDSKIEDDHGEVAWRLRHARRGILKDAILPADILDSDPAADGNGFGDSGFMARAVSPARFASNLLATTPFSGQLNLLTTGSFDTPQQLFATSNFSRSVAYLSVGAPAGSADWTARAALTQGDIASWIVAAEYATRAPARHRYDLGVSYSTQRYDGGNFAALRGVTDGSRNVGAIFGTDTFAITPAITLTYGARYAHYDYLDDRNLLSPRAVLTVQPVDHFRVSASVSRRELAPGAEEFMPRMDSAIWLPPQRTFSALLNGQPLSPERTAHVEVDVERDIAAATFSIRAFRQHVTDQLATLFGVAVPGAPDAHLGHYFVHASGDIDATGIGAGIRAALARRVHGTVEYAVTHAQWNRNNAATYLVLFAPSVVGREADRIHDLSTSIETDVPETSTRVIVLYRLSNGFAQVGSDPARHGDPTDRPIDARFDVQVRQSLPFMDFSTAKWEMLFAIRNFLRDVAPDQSVYDELLVLRPPKRIVGGLTLKF